ncbi:peptidylprolyl isomerase, partial [Mariniblastus sp.]|nr:peptidylprolyl isomerase [Mariniblastus sp.]
GWIAREGPMAPSFTNAAFQLSENEISLPVKTKFGFHLIRCEAIRDSALGWKDVRTELEKNAARDLLQAIVKQHKIQKAN